MRRLITGILLLGLAGFASADSVTYKRFLFICNGFSQAMSRAHAAIEAGEATEEVADLVAYTLQKHGVDDPDVARELIRNYLRSSLPAYRFIDRTTNTVRAVAFSTCMSMSLTANAMARLVRKQTPCRKYEFSLEEELDL